MLSPESHDPKISAAAGRGTYTMEQMEEWIPRALDAGVKGVMIWFFIGMPYQDRQSVMDTIAYSERLIRKFGGWTALPLICPMVPFLDPGCRFFEEPEQHGYRIFHRTLEEHRQALVEPLWHRRLNYETQLAGPAPTPGRLLRGDRPPGGDQGRVRGAAIRVLPGHPEDDRRDTAATRGNGEALLLDGKLPVDLRDEIVPTTARSAYSSDQIIPMRRPFGGRWFDDATVPRQMIEENLRPSRLDERRRELARLSGRRAAPIRPTKKFSFC